MRTPVVSLRPSNTLGDAIKIILAKDIGRIIVTDDKGLLIGIVDREDVLRSLLK
jgi:predicted transcriptional regulator